MKCSDCSKAIRPVVAVDIDGTIANYHRHFFRFAAQWLGGNLDWLYWDESYHGQEELSVFMGLDKRTYRQIKLAYRQGGMKRSMVPIYGWVNLFDSLLELEVEIWLTTTRPYLQVGNVDEDTRAWLSRWKIPFDHLLYGDEKYKDLIVQVDINRIACVLENQVFPDYNTAYSYGLSPILVQNTYNSDEVMQVELIEGPVSHTIVDGLIEASEIVVERVNTWKKDHHASA